MREKEIYGKKDGERKREGLRVVKREMREGEMAGERGSRSPGPLSEKTARGRP